MNRNMENVLSVPMFGGAPKFAFVADAWATRPLRHRRDMVSAELEDDPEDEIIRHLVCLAGGCCADSRK